MGALVQDWMSPGRIRAPLLTPDSLISCTVRMSCAWAQLAASWSRYRRMATPPAAIAPATQTATMPQNFSLGGVAWRKISGWSRIDFSGLHGLAAFGLTR